MSSHLNLTSRSFWMPKLGNSEEEYEDSVAFDASWGRFAIADGAAESSFARSWAQILVEGFVAQPPAVTPRRMLQWLALLQERWRESVPWSSLPWYAEDKARAGACCTFLGLRFKPISVTGELAWKAVAIGDCNLFQLRDGVLVKAFPMTRSEQFGNTPCLLPSVTNRAFDLARLMVRTASRAQVHDVFILATDALAQRCLRFAEAGQPCWTTLLGNNNQEAFRAWIDQLRSDHQIRNDDVSLLLVEVNDGLATT